MRLDSLLPVILIACLIALAYFLTKAVQASRDTNNPEPAPIQLDQNDYGQSSSSTSANTDTDLGGEPSGSSSTTNTEDATEREQDGYQAEQAEDETPATDDSYRVSTGSSYTPTDDVGSNNSSGSTASSGNSSSRSNTAYRSQGDYLVVAGSYRERINADVQMRKLHRAGFPYAEVEIFDRGTYALVVVNTFDGYNDAVVLKNQLKAKGFDAYVHRAE
ncbi:MAG: SPOR domain-containing protein [Bacteroidota bacterium]